jgi:DNA ligase-1
VLFDELVRTSSAVAETSARSAKTRLIADCLRAAAPDEVGIVVAYLAGELRQRRTGLGYASLRDMPAAAATPSLTVAEVDAAFHEMSALAGAGSATRRRELFGALAGRATAGEQRLIACLVGGELRQGAMDGVMLDAIALAAALPAADVRRAVMLAGATGPVAEAALTVGAAGLAVFALQVGRPVRPMLAQPGADVADALAKTGPAAAEWKLDGIRVQIHRDGDEVAVFSRSLDDITARVPDIVAATLALPVRSVVLDGEAIALRPDGRPLPFQATAARSARQDGAAAVPLTAVLFDCLHLDGADLLTAPAADRRAALERVVPAALLAPRAVVTSVEAGEEVLAAALAAGHEGIVLKSLSAPYDAGRRGAAWVKVKPVHTLDLVVLAAEWGHGRRKPWLSNLHLGARDPAGGFVMLGKTFKGMTDTLLAWQTEALLARAVSDPKDWVVHVRPELVVEIAFDGVQTSPRYPGGVALRFARVLRYREDKTAAEADTIEAVRAMRVAAKMPYSRRDSNAH